MKIRDAMKIFDNLEIGVQIIDENFRYVYLNNSILNDVNKSRDEHIGKTMSEVYPGIEHTKVFKKISLCLKNSVPQKFKNEFIFEDNTITYWEITIEKIHEGVLVFSRNITDTEDGAKLLLESNLRLKKEIEKSSELLNISLEKLDEENLKFSIIFNHLPDPCMIVDFENFQISDCNPAMTKILEASKKEIIGETIYKISPDHQEHVKLSSKEYGEKIAKELIKSSFVRFESEHKSFTGRQLFVDASVSFIIMNGRKKLLCVWKDNTLLKKQQEEIQLQTKIAQNNAKLASVGLLAAGVGHEINNPLTIITGYLYSIRYKYLNKDAVPKNELLKVFSKIEIASERIAKIVSGLRTFSRDDNDLVNFFSPVKVICENYDLLSNIYERDKIHLQLDIQSESRDILLFGSRGKFQQVIINLLSNAKDAVAKKNNKKISISSGVEDGYIKVVVEDNGSGIPFEVQEKMYDPFYTTKDVNRGTGIGLSLVHDFVYELDGRLELQTEIDKGTKFTVLLPLEKYAQTSPSFKKYNFDSLFTPSLLSQ